MVSGEGAASGILVMVIGDEQVWLLQGVVLYCILSGRDVPFDSMTQPEMVKHRAELQHTALVGDEWDHISGKLEQTSTRRTPLVQGYLSDPSSHRNSDAPQNVFDPQLRQRICCAKCFITILQNESPLMK